MTCLLTKSQFKLYKTCIFTNFEVPPLKSYNNKQKLIFTVSLGFETCMSQDIMYAKSTRQSLWVALTLSRPISTPTCKSSGLHCFHANCCEMQGYFQPTITHFCMNFLRVTSVQEVFSNNIAFFSSEKFSPIFDIEYRKEQLYLL